MCNPGTKCLRLRCFFPLKHTDSKKKLNWRPVGFSHIYVNSKWGLLKWFSWGHFLRCTAQKEVSGFGLQAAILLAVGVPFSLLLHFLSSSLLSLYIVLLLRPIDSRCGGESKGKELSGITKTCVVRMPISTKYTLTFLLWHDIHTVITFFHL